MQLHELLIAPFAEFAFMRRALAGSIALAIAGPPLGVFNTPEYLKRSVTGVPFVTVSPRSMRTLGPRSDTPTWS